MRREILKNQTGVIHRQIQRIAGFFDGGVYVKGTLSSELCLADNFGCITSRDGNGGINYYQGIDFDFGSNMKFRKGLLVSIA